MLLARPDAREDELQSVLDRARVSEFLPLLAQGVDTVIGDQSAGLSVGRAQRVAVARALLNLFANAAGRTRRQHGRSQRAARDGCA